MTDWQCFLRVFTREWCLLKRQKGLGFQPLMVYVLIACLLPLGLPVSPLVLSASGPAVLWMGLLLAMQLSLLGGFSNDERTGTLSMWQMSPFPLSWIVLPIMLCRWARFMLPLLCVYPLLALMYHFTGHAVIISELAVFLGSWMVFCIGFVLSALLVRLLRQGWLLSCLMFPLCVPPLILVSAIGRLAMHKEMVAGPMAWLAILAILCVCITPSVTSLALQLGMACEEENAF